MTAHRAVRVMAAVIGLGGAIAALLPPVVALDEQVGLATLFRTRGVRNPPQVVEVIAISEASSNAHGLPPALREWPRALHARLVDALAAADVAAIVFDIAFEEARAEAGDRQLGEAIARSGRVILLERIRARQVELAGLETPARRLTQVPAVARIGDAALGRGPFTLPTVPIRTSQFWAFGASAADGPTLPALAAQTALVDVYPVLHERLARLAVLPDGLPATRESLLEGRRLEDAMRTLRKLFVDNPGLARRILAEIAGSSAERRRLEALVALYGGPDSRYLNFYGPSRTVPTRAYHDIVRPDGGQGATEGLRGKVVFVGFSEQEQIAQQDEFVSVFSEASGLSLSGVEFGATAFANLVTNDTVEPVGRPAELALLAFWGFALTLLAARRRLWLGYLSIAAAAAAYFGFAASSFSVYALWLPLVVPLGLQLPAALLGTTLLRYRRVVLQRELLRNAFGAYSAPAVIDQLARESARRPEPSPTVHGTCLFADVSGYTALGERLPPAELAALMEAYFAEVGAVVHAAGGTVADIAGDSVVGLWVTIDSSGETSTRAAAAALRLDAAIGAFNRDRGTSLQTPVGLEAGAVTLASQPHGLRGGFRPVGDMVNTAARIQSLNRHLGTRVLASAAVRSALGDWPGRCVGRFRLFGKQQALEVWELRDPVHARSTRPGDAEFAEGLALFSAGELVAARDRFAGLAAGAGRDGVAAFYLRECEGLLATGLPPEWSGTVVMRGK